MASNTKRTHIVIPADLIDAVDRLVGSRGRSEFVATALREKLARVWRTRTLTAAAGALHPAAHLEWDTPEKTSAWVRDLRTIGNAGTARKLGRQEE